MTRRIRNAAVPALAGALLLCAAAFADGAAYPRGETAEVRVAAPADMDRLAASGLVVDNVEGLTARVCLREGERAALDALGFPYRILPPEAPDDKTILGYRANPEIEAAFGQWARDYPGLCATGSLGTSAQGRNLWYLRITTNPSVEADKPAVKLLSTIHGNEPVGTELLLNLAELLLEGYGADPRLTALVDTTDLWLVPLMNPDGMEARSRYNANSQDLNRVFPVYSANYTGTFFDSPLGDGDRQPEVAAVMRWSASRPFVLAANFHGGALVVNYPYDHKPGVPSGQPAISPDEDLLRVVSLAYSSQNPGMYASVLFPQGVTNGSAWYAATGTMQDWSYRFMGCLEVTVELGETKWPTYTLLPSYWEANREAILAYIETAQTGVRGLCLDRATGAPVLARVDVAGNGQPVFSSPHAGNYHRLLLPGTYSLSWEAPGHITYHVDGVAVAGGPATRRDVAISDGDLNADGAVGAADIQLAVNAVLGDAVGVDADVDGRGLSATDIQAVINRSLGR
ncbi:MAG TPA: M14 family zinc carboxypeptidase [Candidatus Hydrogenedentes bacterium]|nr:M14 family zinc carboxypeptidase [Candidatus Hydrogenedentota bacterium]